MAIQWSFLVLCVLINLYSIDCSLLGTVGSTVGSTVNTVGGVVGGLLGGGSTSTGSSGSTGSTGTTGTGSAKADPIVSSFDGRTFEFFGKVGGFYNVIQDADHQVRESDAFFPLVAQPY